MCPFCQTRHVAPERDDQRHSSEDSEDVSCRLSSVRGVVTTREPEESRGTTCRPRSMVSDLPHPDSAVCSTAARSTAARRQERSAESGAMSWPRNRILANQRRAPRPRDQLSPNQGPAWAGSWSLFSLFPRAELRLVTSLRLTATLRGAEEHNTISTSEHPHAYNSNRYIH